MFSKAQLNNIWDQVVPQIQDKPVTLLYAPSGFGKSVFLKHVAREKSFAYCDNRPHLFDGSVFENINLGDNAFEVPLELISDITFGVHEHIHNINRTLSTGQKQRICFLRTLQARSPFIFFDETLSGCQAELVHKCIDFAIEKIKTPKSAKRLVIVLHNFIKLSDDIANLDLTKVKPNL